MAPNLPLWIAKKPLGDVNPCASRAWQDVERGVIPKNGITIVCREESFPVDLEIWRVHHAGGCAAGSVLQAPPWATARGVKALLKLLYLGATDEGTDLGEVYMLADHFGTSQVCSVFLDSVDSENCLAVYSFLRGVGRKADGCTDLLMHACTRAGTADGCTDLLMHACTRASTEGIARYWELRNVDEETMREMADHYVRQGSEGAPHCYINAVHALKALDRWCEMNNKDLLVLWKRLDWEKLFHNKLFVHYVAQFTKNTLPTQHPLDNMGTLDAFLRKLGLFEQPAPMVVNVPPARRGIRGGWNAMCWVGPNVMAVLNNIGRKLIEIRHLTDVKYKPQIINLEATVGHIEFMTCIGDKLYISDCVLHCIWVVHLVTGDVLSKIGPSLKGGVVLRQPHGIAVWEERKLLVADTAQGCIFIIDDQNEAKVFARLDKPVKVSVARKRHVLVTSSSIYGKGAVSVYGPDGTFIDKIECGSRHIDGVAFHPEDDHQFYVGVGSSQSVERYEKTRREARKYALMGSFKAENTTALLMQKCADTCDVLIYVLDGITGYVSASRPWGH